MEYRKNILLKEERNVCFEDVVAQISENKVLDIIRHPNYDKYPDEKKYHFITKLHLYDTFCEK